ncbi:PQQ-binding-like beta-propeller repeat protein [Diaphorobacter ruginosibacter]|uniref:PQQ-binding-like beta-propeller repeat protein n=2 Tax=Diaphorobacter ruginosibacter TaxID=1715720 RepID=A0A7G9RLS9_9BURK|nr:PQQ-binding-like beta-propeller repeat protein [Diaphorobacter ruginosibacter]
MSESMNEASRQTLSGAAEVVHEWGPYEAGGVIHGVSFDGTHVWAATGETLLAVDPRSGAVARSLAVPGDAGTAFDGKHLYQIVETRIDKIEPATGKVVSSIPAPGGGFDSGLTWAEGSLWVGAYRSRKIRQIDPADGRVLRTIESDRFVTGVTWYEGELWHATEENEESELRRIDKHSGAVKERLMLPKGVLVSGLESGGDGLFYAGGGRSGKLRAVRRARPA